MKFPVIALLVAVAVGAPHGTSSAMRSPSVEHGRSALSTPSVSPTQTTTTGRVPASTIRRGRANIAYARVVLDEQRAYFYNARRRLIATMPVSTGVDDTTPTGTFRVFSKSEITFYAPDPREKMRWMTRFTRGSGGGAIGFHGVPFRITEQGEVPMDTPLGLAPSSHGCVRTSPEDAQWIFENMKLGTIVTVTATRR